LKSKFQPGKDAHENQDFHRGGNLFGLCGDSAPGSEQSDEYIRRVAAVTKLENDQVKAALANDVSFIKTNLWMT
jgi:hypothetical protein